MASLAVVSLLFYLWYSTIPFEWHLRISSIAFTEFPNKATWFLIGLHGYGIDIGPHGDMQVNPAEAFVHGNQTYVQAMTLARLDVFVMFPIVYNFIADFLALIATMSILSQIIQARAATIRRMFVTLLLSACLLLLLSYISLHAAVHMMNKIISVISPVPVAAVPPEAGDILKIDNFVKAFLFPFYKQYQNEWNIGTLYGVFIWSTLMGIIWLGIFATSVIAANASMKLRSVGPWLNRNLHVQRNPFRILAIFVMIPVFVICMVYHAFM